MYNPIVPYHCHKVAMKRLYPVIHKFKLHPGVCPVGYPWGWVSQEVVLATLKQPAPESIAGWTELAERGIGHIHEQNVLEGVKQGYNVIFDFYRDGRNFLDATYTTPSLSCAINSFTEMRKQASVDVPDIYTSDIKVDLIDSWIETGLTHSNDKILGMWTIYDIKRELLIGAAGPEFPSWYSKPLRQRLRVKYTLPTENRIDMWIWERSLIVKDMQQDDTAGRGGGEDWTVCNVNGVLTTSL